LLDDRIDGRWRTVHVLVDDAGLEEFALRSLEFEPADVGDGDRVLSITAAPAEERDSYDEQPELHDERLASAVQ
jgi:hypothetical protein